MKCSGCIHYESKNKPWGSVLPHPCTSCKRAWEPEDNYEPKGWKAKEEK